MIPDTDFGCPSSVMCVFRALKRGLKPSDRSLTEARRAIDKRGLAGIPDAILEVVKDILQLAALIQELHRARASGVALSKALS